MNGTIGDTHGVILSGGGANGAYEIGVLKALFAGKSPSTPPGQQLDPSIFAGTSVGSYNAAFLVSRWGVYGSAAIASLEQLWLDTVSSTAFKPNNSVFRIREDPRPFLYPRSFVQDPIEPFINLVNDSASLAWSGIERAVSLVTAQEPLLERVAQLIDLTEFIALDPFRKLITETVWFSEIRRSLKKLVIAATNWEMGNVRFFENHDMTDDLGPLAVLSSTAIPGVFPPVACGAQLYVDGGVLMNTPLEPVIDRGATVLHVISMFPDVTQIPLGTLGSTLATVYRQQLIGWAKTLQSSIRRVRDINRVLKITGYAAPALAWVREHASAEECERLHIKDIEQHVERYHARPPERQKYVPVTVHQYFPRDDISGALGLLDFDRNRIKALIERGFEDAVQHDCKNNNCVLLEDASPAAGVPPEQSLFDV